MRGRLYRIDDKPVGFCTWEETDPSRGIANSFADLTNGRTRGLPEFILNDMAATLSAAIQPNRAGYCLALPRFLIRFFEMAPSA
jgi:hypothetical protein